MHDTLHGIVAHDVPKALRTLHKKNTYHAQAEKKEDMRHTSQTLRKRKT